ncbi:MAG: D-alanyl-D-alanine carboxypeptidase [Oscillospiraceae bacterium]|nr:D-alanyl-D-alanine carboxypeptidase [Oscillospiraceae bacterium]
MKNIKLKKLKQKTSLGLCVLLIFSCFTINFTFSFGAAAEEKQAERQNQGISVVYPELGIKAEGAILIEAATGTVLFEHNADEAFPPASVTKVMSMLLIMEGIAEGRVSLEDKVTASEYASSMGGSQIYLEPGEQMTLNDMLKAIVVSSANDATVAVAEHLMGSVEAFVARMNERAGELGMKNTVFKNTTGLDDDGHETSARDIAIMSRELLTHSKIFDYTKIWMDTLRDGEFGISNTNRLIRFYTGANGLKTGSTGLAKYCLSASAERNGMQLIAVVMAAPSSDERFAGAKKMLDFGFATYGVYQTPPEELTPVRVTGGVTGSVEISHKIESFLINKGKEKGIEKQIQVAESVAAPVEKGEKIGTINYMLDGNLIKSVDITASEPVERISFWGIFGKMAKKYFLMG